MTQMLQQTQQSAESIDPLPKRKMVDSSRRYATLTFLRGSIVSIGITLVAGLLGALYYIPWISPWMQKMHLNFTALRPIHTTFAVAFIFLGGMAVVHRYFEDEAGPMSQSERIRLRIQVISWAIAGAGILLSIIAGVFSGREYMGFHPIFSIPILLGWTMFAWNFWSHLGKGIFHRPVHVSMWAVGSIFFMYTFIEQHAWLLPSIMSDPIVDLRIQWKATGTLVGSFNLFVYGSLYYIGCKLSGSQAYAHSRLAYALFAVGLLNSFTNFAHHTYHVPQSSLVKWISFVVSMAEIMLLARVVWDISAMVRNAKPLPACGIRMFLGACKWWTGFILVTAITISIPPINALIHGTRAVMGHAMGAEIGIDAMALFAAFTWLIIEFVNQRGKDCAELTCKKYRTSIIGFNIGVAGLVGWLTISGIGTGINRYQGLATPRWIEVAGPYIFVIFGLITAKFLGDLVNAWLKLVFSRDLMNRRKDKLLRSEH